MSRKWVCHVVLGVDVPERCGDAALGHHGVRLAQERLADEPDRRPAARLDRGAQPRAAGADDEDVVVVDPFGLHGQVAASKRMARVVEQARARASRTYTSASVTEKRLAQAQPMWLPLSVVSRCQSVYRDRAGARTRSSRARPPATWRSEWQDSEKPVRSSDVDEEDHARRAPAAHAARRESEAERVEPQEEQRDGGEVQEVAVEVLEDERERALHRSTCR